MGDFIGQKGTEKILAIMRDNMGSGGSGLDLSNLSDFFLTKSEIEEMLNNGNKSSGVSILTNEFTFVECVGVTIKQVAKNIWSLPRWDIGSNEPISMSAMFAIYNPSSEITKAYCRYKRKVLNPGEVDKVGYYFYYKIYRENSNETNSYKNGTITTSSGASPTADYIGDFVLEIPPGASKVVLEYSRYTGSYNRPEMEVEFGELINVTS